MEYIKMKQIASGAHDRHTKEPFSSGFFSLSGEEKGFSLSYLNNLIGLAQPAWPLFPGTFLGRKKGMAKGVEVAWYSELSQLLFWHFLQISPFEQWWYSNVSVCFSVRKNVPHAFFVPFNAPFHPVPFSLFCPFVPKIWIHFKVCGLDFWLR